MPRNNNNEDLNSKQEILCQKETKKLKNPVSQTQKPQGLYA